MQELWEKDRCYSRDSHRKMCNVMLLAVEKGDESQFSQCAVGGQQLCVRSCESAAAAGRE